MPPFKGRSPVFTGAAVAALWELPAGEQVAIVGETYPVPSANGTANLRTASISEGLRVVLDMIDTVGAVVGMTPATSEAQQLDEAQIQYLRSIGEVACQHGYSSVEMVEAADEWEKPADTGELVAPLPSYGETVTIREAAYLLGLSDDALRKRMAKPSYGLPYVVPASTQLVRTERVMQLRATLLQRLEAREFSDESRRTREYNSEIAVAQAAQLLGLSDDAVRKRINSGSLTGVRPTGSGIRISANEILTQRADLLRHLGAQDIFIRVVAVAQVKKLGFHSRVLANPGMLVLRTHDLRPYVGIILTLSGDESSGNNLVGAEGFEPPTPSV